ncbi:MAG: C_GCAxxG_C_C family protein [Oscillospiraceae bacterium]|nr:C_GCAxxG_C_C family protein [Oscillospiraceae bacterium]
MDHSIKAGELFLTGANCSQAVVLAFEDLTGLDRTTALKLSSAFGGGIGRMREVCGAVSGMFMVMGLLYGYTEPGEKDCNKKALYKDVQVLADQFREEVGSIICRDILKNPPSDPTPTPRDAEFYKVRPCARMVMTAARILDKYIAEHPLENI